MTLSDRIYEFKHNNEEELHLIDEYYLKKYMHEGFGYAYWVCPDGDDKNWAGVGHAPTNEDIFKAVKELECIRTKDKLDRLDDLLKLEVAAPVNNKPRLCR